MKNENKYSPDWYWSRGLHDAEVLSMDALEQEADWQQQQPPCRYLELALNCHHAMFEQHITKITFYHYHIIHEDLDRDNNKDRLWWLHDELTTLPDSRYLLKIVFCKGNRNDLCLHIKFRYAKIERTQ